MFIVSTLVKSGETALACIRGTARVESVSLRQTSLLWSWRIRKGINLKRPEIV